MSLFKRVTRLFKADMHGILDTLEEPEEILKQALREMEADIELTRRKLKELQKNQERLANKETDMAEKLQELEQQILFCFKQNNDDFAKSRIRKKLEITRFRKTLIKNKQALADEKNELQNELDDRLEKLTSITDKLDLLTDQNLSEWTADAAVDTDDNTRIGVVTQEDVELAFMHAKQQWTQSDASNAAGD